MSVHPTSNASKTSTVIQSPPNRRSTKDSSTESVQHVARRSLSCSAEPERTTRKVIIVGGTSHKISWRASSVPPHLPELAAVTIERNPENIKIDTQIKSLETIDDLIQYCIDTFEKLDGLNASTAIGLIAQKCVNGELGPKKHILLCQLVALISSHLNSFGPTDLSKTARALATLNFNDGKLFQKIAREVLKKSGNLTPENIADLAWACAARGYCNEELLQALALKSLPQLPQFNHENITEIAAAFARFGFAPASFFKGLAKRALVLAETLTPHQISNIAAAFAAVNNRRKSPHRTFLNALAMSAVRQIEDFSLVQICKTARALATLGYPGREFREAIERKTLAYLPAMSAENIAIWAWSLVRMRATDAALFGAIAREALPKLTIMDSKCIANLARVFNQIRFADDSFFLAIAMAALPGLKDLMPKDLDLIVSICARLGEALANETRLKVPHMTPQEIANTACVFVTIGVKDERLFQTIEKETISQIREFTPLNIASIAKAFAMVNLLERTFLEEMIRFLPRYPRQDELSKLKYVWEHFKQKQEAHPLKWPQELLDSFAEFDIV